MSVDEILINTRTTKGGQNDLFEMVGSRYTSIVGSSSVKETNLVTILDVSKSN